MDVPNCMSEDIRIATMEDEHLCAFAKLVLHSCPFMKTEV